MRIIAFFLLLVTLVAVPALATQATPNAAVNLSSVPAASSPLAPSTMLSPAAAQLSQQIQSLVTPIAPSATPAVTTPANTADTPPSDDVQDIGPNIGTKMLDFVMAAVELTEKSGSMFISNLYALPQISAWYSTQQSDPKLAARWQIVGDNLIHAVLPAFISALLLEIAFIPVRRKLLAKKTESVADKSRTLLLLFVVRMIPIAVFAGLSASLIGTGEMQKLPRFIILNVVYALALERIVVGISRGILAPNINTLRLLPVTTKQARFAYKWVVIFSALLIYGYFALEVARAVRMPESTINVFGNIFGLLLVGMTIAVIVKARRYVADILRGVVPPMPRDRTWFESLRVALSKEWHILAIAYLVIGYIITALDVQNAFILMLRGTVISLCILVAMQLALSAIRDWGRASGYGALNLHREVLRFMVALCLWGLAFLGIAAAWGANITLILNTPLGHRLSSAALSVIVTTGTLALLYEVISSAIDRHITRRSPDGMAYIATARSRTLLPMFRNVLFFLFAMTVVIVFLSEAGFNIGPLLAGAGVVGVAIGFGSQTLVKDFLTGLFIVAENTISIGDIIKIGDHKGMVEAMSIRTLRLRDMETGDLHILPFSDVTSIINMTKGFSYASFKIGVGYDTDIDIALKAMKEVGDDMRKDPQFVASILQDIEVQGLDALGDYAITLSARICTHAGKQWDVKRAYLQRVKKRFDALGIEIPYPISVQYHKNLPTIMQPTDQN